MRKISGILIAFMVLFAACNSTPDYVLSHEEMAQLLADVHIGESLIDANRQNYKDDSLKKELKQSILHKHNVTAQQLDTSFEWYGHNIEDYIEVYDRVIEILENQQANVKVEDGVQLAVAGDSADAWSGVRYRQLSRYMANNYVSFAIDRDENWEKGDVYEWRMKRISGNSPLLWTLAVDYADGSSEYVNASKNKEGWQELVLYTDSSKTASRVYGIAHINLTDKERVYIDSISLVRSRFSEDKYVRRYNQRKFRYGRKKNAKK
ncbi:MAG: DUF4296 domain-containing protein [Muribaculaceae bacterium]|jgi:hypothetical protein|nr:DUF4296 domain-containing protein [Muribaculaceae bacterium]